VVGKRVKVDPEQVIHETVDGEVILIALQTGCYYSLEGSGADIWDALVAGRSAGEVTASLEQRYAAPAGAIAATVAELVERLLAEQLLVPEKTDIVEPSPLHAVAEAERPPFPAPVLHKFTDMQDFLLVDPIHEVSDEGWPHVEAVGGGM
jgi:Coenzyme PQQ synthesis protein D (PqqD)